MSTYFISSFFMRVGLKNAWGLGSLDVERQSAVTVKVLVHKPIRLSPQGNKSTCGTDAMTQLKSYEHMDRTKLNKHHLKVDRKGKANKQPYMS